MLMAAARLNLPSVFLYAGSILPGRLGDQALDITSVFEAVGAHAAGTLDDAGLLAVERNACPGEGACAGMFTANTMRSEEHTSELQSLMRISYAVFCWKTKTK